MKGHIINLENKSDWLAPVWKKCTDWPPATTQVLCVTVDPWLTAFWIAFWMHHPEKQSKNKFIIRVTLLINMLEQSTSVRETRRDDI